MTKKEIQAYLKRKDISIEHNTARWEINANGDINGLYTGYFVFKCFLTPSEKLAAGRDYRDMLGSNASLAIKHEDNLAFMLAQLKYRVIAAPPFWSSATGRDGIMGDLPDEKVLDTIFEAALSAEFKYLATIQEKKDAAIDKAKKVAESMIEDKEAEEAKKEEKEDEDEGKD